MQADRQQREDDQQASFRRQRLLMVERQIAARGVQDERVLAAMKQVPRDEFVPVESRGDAYLDCPLPIGYGQTISQPYTVAMMCEALQLAGTEKVLEIGTGSGYAASVLSLLAREVHTVECIPELAAEARERIRRLGYSNVQVYVADGTLGLPELAPFDGIVVTAGGPSLPQAYREQLAEGGRIVMPIGDRAEQQMLRYTRRHGQLSHENLGMFCFVPLVGAAGWDG